MKLGPEFFCFSYGTGIAMNIAIGSFLSLAASVICE